MANGQFNKKPFSECFECFKKKKPVKDENMSENSAVPFRVSAYSAINHHSIKPLTLTHVSVNGDWKMRLAQPHSSVKLVVHTNIDKNNCIS